MVPNDTEFVATFPSFKVETASPISAASSSVVDKGSFASF